MDQKGKQLAAMLSEIRQRVRARYPDGNVASGDLILADLTPLLHARDAAEGKVASIGTVNPRPPGPLNSIFQSVKRMVARALDWHVREQVEFNRAVIGCVQASLESFNECNRALAALSARIDGLAPAFDQLRAEARELADIRAHWTEWRSDWENKLANNEIRFLRSIAELQAAYHHRVTLMDASHREQIKAQHADFEGALARGAEQIQKSLWTDMEEFQKRFWTDLQHFREEYDGIIHAELRVLRQKASFTHTAEQVAQSAPPEFSGIDWLRFAERFRGSEETIRQRQRMYAERFQSHAPVLDLGCGRGEMLEVFRDAGIAARGIDLNEESIALSKSKGLDVDQADMFAYLGAQPDASLGGAVCCQVVEHLPPERLAELVRLVHAKLRPRGLIAIETPNPECLAIFATHFYLDPTHRHPVPAPLLSFYLGEAGFGGIEVARLYPAVESMPSVGELPEAFRRDFFGALDYAIFGKKT